MIKRKFNVWSAAHTKGYKRRFVLNYVVKFVACISIFTLLYVVGRMESKTIGLVPACVLILINFLILCWTSEVYDMLLATKQKDQQEYYNVHNTNMHCNMCDSDLTYVQVDTTHIWVCPDCANVQFEYIEEKDLQNVETFLHRTIKQ